jgi:hypothetical protein
LRSMYVILEGGWRLNIMKRAIQYAVVAAFLVFLAGTVKADPVIYSYMLTGPSTDVTFDLAELPTATNVTVGGGFFVTPTNLIIDGSPSTDTLIFYNMSDDGAFQDNPPDPMAPLAFSLAGAQLYSGSENNPQMLLGMYTLYDFIGYVSDPQVLIPYSLDVSQVTTPEPGTLLLFGTGLIALVLMRKRYALN